MKRWIAMLLALAIAFGCVTAIAEKAPRTGADLSYERIVAMARYMRELATGDYLDIKQVPENHQNVAASWAAGISDAPRMVIQLDINEFSGMLETRAYFQQEPEIVSYEAESSTMGIVFQYLAYYASQEAGLTESGYDETMQVNSHISASQMYAEEGTQGNAMYIVLYDGAAPIMLLVNAENGAVSIQGMFLPSAKLSKCQNYGQVSLWLMLNGFAMSCSEIKPE